MTISAVAKVALVTGASSGIGKAMALAFARAGYATVLSDVQCRKAARARASSLVRRSPSMAAGRQGDRRESGHAS